MNLAWVTSKTIWLKLGSFEYALYRNHYYRLADREECLKDLLDFCIDGKNVRIIESHPWKLSSGRRKRTDSLYSKFSLERDYGIVISERKQIPGPSPMYEPWMLRTAEDEPGTIDFRLRDNVKCGDSIMSRNMIGLLATIVDAKLQDF